MDFDERIEGIEHQLNLQVKWNEVAVERFSLLVSSLEQLTEEIRELQDNRISWCDIRPSSN